MLHIAQYLHQCTLATVPKKSHRRKMRLMRNVDEGYTHFRRRFHLRHTRHRLHEPCKICPPNMVQETVGTLWTHRTWKTYQENFTATDSQLVSTQKDFDESKASIMPSFSYPSLLSCIMHCNEHSILKGNNDTV